jgi:hypothetical protein
MTYIELSEILRRDRARAKDKIQYWQTVRTKKPIALYQSAISHLLQTSTPTTKQEIIIEIMTLKFNCKEVENIKKIPF